MSRCDSVRRVQVCVFRVRWKSFIIIRDGLVMWKFGSCKTQKTDLYFRVWYRPIIVISLWNVHLLCRFSWHAARPYVYLIFNNFKSVSSGTSGESKIILSSINNLYHRKRERSWRLNHFSRLSQYCPFKIYRAKANRRPWTISSGNQFDFAMSRVAFRYIEGVSRSLQLLSNVLPEENSNCFSTYVVTNIPFN